MALTHENGMGAWFEPSVASGAMDEGSADRGIAGLPGGDGLPAPVYAELRRIAASYLRKERRDHTLRTTALAHEAYLRLVSAGTLPAGDRAAFCAAAAQAIRRILVDCARRRARLKRGGGACRRDLQLESAVLAVAPPTLDLLDLEAALARLEVLAPRQAQVVELRFFGGLSEGDAARTLGVDRRTIQRDWRGARAWLRRELNADSNRRRGDDDA